MKFLFRWAFRLLVLLVVLAVAGILLLDPIARELTEQRLRMETGMDAKIGRMSVGLLSPVIEIENLKLYNPAEFGGSPFIDMPELHVEYDRNALFSRKVRCKLVRFNLAELNLVQNKKGVSNVQLLAKPGPSAPPAATTATTATTSTNTSNARIAADRSFRFAGIDVMNVTLGRVTMMSMSDPGHPKELRMGIRNQVVPDIKNEQDLEVKIALLLAPRGGFEVFQFFSAPQAK